MDLKMANFITYLTVNLTSWTFFSIKVKTLLQDSQCPRMTLWFKMKRCSVQWGWYIYIYAEMQTSYAVPSIRCFGPHTRLVSILSHLKIWLIFSIILFLHNNACHSFERFGETLKVLLCHWRLEETWKCLPFLPSFVFFLSRSLVEKVESRYLWRSSVDVLVTLKGGDILQSVGESRMGLLSLQLWYSLAVLIRHWYHVWASNSLSIFSNRLIPSASSWILWPCFFDLVQYQSTLAVSKRTLF